MVEKSSIQMSDSDLLVKIEESVLSRDISAVEKNLPGLRKAGIASTDALNALSRGIERAREKFKRGTYAIPDFLLAIDAYRKGLSFIHSGTEITMSEARPQIVIGVVKGDVHDMGKNIVAAVLEASGYQVLDVGKNVENDVFLDALQETNADILALSTMMSTTLETMRQLIVQARRKQPDLSILVGGAPFDPDLARRMGADGYAENAIALPEEARRVIAENKSIQLHYQPPPR